MAPSYCFIKVGLFIRPFWFPHPFGYIQTGLNKQRVRYREINE